MKELSLGVYIVHNDADLDAAVGHYINVMQPMDIRSQIVMPQGRPCPYASEYPTLAVFRIGAATNEWLYVDVVYVPQKQIVKAYESMSP